MINDINNINILLEAINKGMDFLRNKINIDDALFKAWQDYSDFALKVSTENEKKINLYLEYKNFQISIIDKPVKDKLLESIDKLLELTKKLLHQ